MELIEKNTEKCLIIGSGSNLLFINDFNGLVIHPCLLYTSDAADE